MQYGDPVTQASESGGGPAPGADRNAVRRFIAFDRLGALAGVPLILLVNGLVYRSAAIWSILPVLLVLVGLLTLARRTIDRPGERSLLVALAAVTAGNWLVALYVPLVLPFLWPALALVVIMPLVLASPHLSRRQVMPALVAGGLVAGAVAAIGLVNDDGGAVPDIDDGLELALVIGALMLVIAVIGLIVSQNNDLQRRNLTRAVELNRRLERSQEELAASRRRVVEAADTERRRIERDLHDGAQQRLVAIGVHLRLLESQTIADDAVRTSVESLVGEIDAAVEELRELAQGIHPPLLRSQGLGPALAAAARRSPGVEHRLDDVDRLDPSVESALYFAALEAMTNATKHAPGARVAVTLAEVDGRVELTVADDGPGFEIGVDVESEIRTLGTHHMGDRLAAVGGDLLIDSGKGRGTTVTALVPVHDETS